MKNFLIPLLMVGLVGCVMPTKQAPPDQVRDVPSNRRFEIDPQSQPVGKITVTRDVGILGSGCFLGVMVDGRIAAHLEPAERVEFELGQGRHVLTATLVGGKGLCGLSSEKRNAARRRSTEILVQPNAVQAYRIYSTTEDFPAIEPAF